jgi:hypothetical protein
MEELLQTSEANWMKLHFVVSYEIVIKIEVLSTCILKFFKNIFMLQNVLTIRVGLELPEKGPVK